MAKIESIAVAFPDKVPQNCPIRTSIDSLTGAVYTDKFPNVDITVKSQTGETPKAFVCSGGDCELRGICQIVRKPLRPPLSDL